jgi:hypothetical protein
LLPLQAPKIFDGNYLWLRLKLLWRRLLLNRLLLLSLELLLLLWCCLWLSLELGLLLPLKLLLGWLLLLPLKPGLQIRIRIGSGFNRVSGSGSRRAKMTHKSRKKF